MIQNCKFCKERDLKQVVPGLSVDIQQAIDTGVVLDTGVIEAHNDIQDPTSIVTRVRDTFHALELKKAYLNAGKIDKGTSMSGSTENNGVVLSSSVSSNESSGGATEGA